MSKTVADHLSEVIVGRAEFQDEYGDLEYIVAEKFLSNTTSRLLNDETVENLLRYADVLSHSSTAEYRQLAYAIVALLMEYEAEVGLTSSLAAKVRTIAKAVMESLDITPITDPIRGGQTVLRFPSWEFLLQISSLVAKICTDVLNTLVYKQWNVQLTPLLEL